MTFRKYANYYDIIYQDKKYDEEVRFLNTIFKKYGNPKSILEVGCGTGNYTKLLLGHGFNVTGIDLSSEMLKLAKMKCKGGEFFEMDMKKMTLNRKFDTVIAMFAVIGYLIKNEEIINVFRNVYNHLKDNGLFIFDVWNGLAVLRILPTPRIKEIDEKDIKIIRIALPELLTEEHVCNVNYKLLILHKKESKFEEINEEHKVRFYFPKEITHLLNEAGFKVLKICPFLDLNKKLDEYTWNMCVVAKKSKSPF